MCVNSVAKCFFQVCRIYYRTGLSVPNCLGQAVVFGGHCVLAFSPVSLFLASLCVPLLFVGAGADFVMLGGMFAGHDQCAGEIIEKNGKKVKLFYGMSSDTAMKKHAGGVAEYRYEFHTGAIAVSQLFSNLRSGVV